MRISAGPSPERHVTRHRDFRLLWVGTTTTRLGSSVSSVATPLVALEVLDASTLTVSLLTAAAWLPWLVIGLPAGAWLDRVAKRPVLITTDVVSAVLVLSVPLTVWAGRLTVAHLLTVALLLGTASVFFQTAWTGYLPALLDRRDVVPANSVLHGSESAAQVAGPGVAGQLAAVAGAVAGLLLDAFSFVVSAVCLLRIRRPERRAEPSVERHLRREMAQGLRFVATDRFLRCLVSHGALSNLALTGYQSILVVFLVRDVGLGAASVGMVLALASLGGVVGAAAAPWLARHVGDARTLVLCKAGAGPCALLVPLATPGAGLGFLVAGSALTVAGIVAGNVISGSFRQTYSPPALLSRVTTSMQFVNLGTIPLGAVLAGTLATALGTRTAIWIMVATYAASGLVLVLGPLRGRRDLPRAAAVSAPV